MNELCLFQGSPNPEIRLSARWRPGVSPRCVRIWGGSKIELLGAKIAVWRTIFRVWRHFGGIWQILGF